jgi:Nucleoside-diphosphate-sugar epimerases
MSGISLTKEAGPVVVTGSGGFIGSHIVLNLVKRGYQVRACVRDASNVLANAPSEFYETNWPWNLYTLFLAT